MDTVISIFIFMIAKPTFYTFSMSVHKIIFSGLAPQ